jgi:DNA-binding CsgD family transcriptional regulator
LVGRGAETRVLRAYLDRSSSVVLAGVSGVGKTRLARELLAELAADGRPGRWVSATRSSQAIPLGVLGPLLPSDTLESVGPTAPLEFVNEMRRGLTRDGGPLPLVVVDDAHLADDVSAMVLHQLVMSGAAVVLLTVRTAEPAPDAVTALWKDGWAERVELQPLSRAETDELIDATLGGSCGSLELHSLWEASQGNPLYVRELIRSATASGALREIEGRWRLARRVPVGDRLVELITARIAQLSEAAREGLDITALADPVPMEVVDELTEIGGLAEAERAGLIEIGPEGDRMVVRAAHPMFGEVVRALMPVARQRWLAGRLADGYARVGLQRREDLLRCVTWKLDSGGTGDPEMLIAGARQAAEALDHGLAERLARAAVSAAPTDQRAKMALAESLYRQGRYREVLAELDGTEPRSDTERAELAVFEAKTLWFGVRDTAAAEAVLARADATVVTAPARAWLAAYRAKLRAALGFPVEAVAMAASVAADPDQEPEVTLTALGAVANGSAFSGRVDDALAAARRWQEPRLAAAARSHELSDWGPAAAWVAAFLGGDVVRAASLAAAYLRLGLEQRHDKFVAVGSVTTGWVELLQGDVVTAERRLGEGWEVLRTEDWAGGAILAGAGLALARVFSGDIRGARTALVEARAARTTSLVWFDPLVEISAAWVEAADGDAAGAAAHLDDVASSAQQRGQFPYELQARHGCARLGQASDVADRLASLVSIVDGPFATVAAAHAAALATGDALGLEAATDALERLDMRILAAEAAATASARYQAVGDRSRAASLGLRCETLLSSCPGASSPSIHRLRSLPTLTSRELEVARMAVGGQSSRQIAEQLVVSVRTVETHLGHVYAKLGVAGRPELAAALGTTAAAQ